METHTSIMMHKVAELKRNERMTRAQLDLLHIEKFRGLVKQIIERSPYYAAIIRRHAIDPDQCLPSQFPVLTKSSLIAHFDAIVTDRAITKASVAEFAERSTDPTDLYLDRYRVIYSSGSSGEVGFFVYSEDDWARGMAQSLRRAPPPDAPPDRVLRRTAFYGLLRPRLGGVTTLATMTDRSRTDLRLFDINRSIEETIAALNEFQPHRLCGYTTPLLVLAEKQRDATLNIQPQSVATVGEALTEIDREVLQSTFHCAVSNAYGSSEHLLMGFQIPGSRNMLLHDDDLIYEFYGDHTIVTNLFNTTLPLIRYRMGDVIRTASCRVWPHLPYLEVEMLVGRAERMPMVVTEDGIDALIYPHSIMAMQVAGMRRLQLQIVDRAVWRLLVCLEKGLSQSAKRNIMKRVEVQTGALLAHARLRKVGCEVIEAAEIPLNRVSGKFQFLVDLRGAVTARSQSVDK